MGRKNWSRRLWSEEYKRKKLPRDDLARQAEAFRAEGKTIATLNGSFDLLHAGHLQIFYEASQQADLLLVALNSDTSIRQYKSSDRPMIPLEYRMQMVAMLECVDYVTWFDETTPLNIFEEIKPDVHVNGADYGEECLEADLIRRMGGRLHLVDLVPGLSTSQIIQKIQELETKGATCG